MAEYSPEDLRQWFRARAEDYFRVHPGLDRAWYRDLDFTPAEARFLWAVEEGIVSVDASCRFHLPGVNRSTGKPTEPGVFSRPETALRTHTVKLEWREYLTQVVALAELVHQYGWPKERVALDPEARGAWTFDLAVFRDRTGVPPWIIAAETKSPISAGELDGLGRRLLSWSAAGTTPDPSDGSKPAKAFRGLLRTQPEWLWLVAPGRKREAFRLGYGNGGRLLMESAEDIPRFDQLPGERPAIVPIAKTEATQRGPIHRVDDHQPTGGSGRFAVGSNIRASYWRVEVGDWSKMRRPHRVVALDPPTGIELWREKGRLVEGQTHRLNLGDAEPWLG